MDSFDFSALKGHCVAITGKVAVPRKAAAELIQRAGATFCPRVTPATDVLIVGKLPESHSRSEKYLRAVRFGTTIIPGEAVFGKK